MLQMLRRILHRLYFTRIRPDERVITYYRFMDAGGESLRLDYPLQNESLVVDAGGFEGEFAADIVDRFHCRVDVFEPVGRYAEKLRERFAANSKVHVIQAGIGAEGREEWINVAGISSTLFGDESGGQAREKIKIVPVMDYLRDKHGSMVDLMKINIEGGEYELLHALLECPDVMRNIRFLQIQFHDFVPDAERMRDEIRERLSETHRLMWDFPFIWESWELKS